MPDNNKLELVVEVDANKANAPIKSVNTGLSSMEQAASKAARGVSAGIDGLTVSIVKGATAGNLLAGAIKHGVEWLKEWTIDVVKSAANTDCAAEALEKIMLAIESGQGGGLREVGIFANLNKETERAQKLAELHGKELDDNAIKEIRRVAIMREAAKMEGPAAAAAGV